VYPERTTDHGQATGKLHHLRLRVDCTFFVIYKAGREKPNPLLAVREYASPMTKALKLFLSF
jgi:hypothetical protein